MSEVTAKFDSRKKGYYVRDEVDNYVRDVEKKLDEKDEELDSLHEQVSVLQEKLSFFTNDDVAVEEKVELYDKLMKKMGDDYQNLLAPAIAKAKLIEEESNKEYALRMDQAKYSAEGIYTQTAEKIGQVVDANMDRLYGLLDDFIYSKTLAGRLDGVVKSCRSVSKKLAQGIAKMMDAPKSFAGAFSDAVKSKKEKEKDAVVEQPEDVKEETAKEAVEETTEATVVEPADEIAYEVAKPEVETVEEPELLEESAEELTEEATEDATAEPVSEN